MIDQLSIISSSAAMQQDHSTGPSFFRGSFIIVLSLFLITPGLSFQIQSQTPPLTAIAKTNYPVRFGYIDRIFEWQPVERLASSLGVPGYSDEKIYNYLSLGFWKCGDVPSEAALVWSKPLEYFGDDSIFGKTKSEIQLNLKKKYADGKVQLLVSAFGPQEKPTSLGLDWQDCANGLASFVLDNSLDGCDVNWQDSDALLSGSGQKWLSNFHSHLRKLLPNHTVTHSPLAGYFSPQRYPRGNYLSLNTDINKTLNFYNLQFFNQGTKYANYSEIFIEAPPTLPGTAVAELVRLGVDQKKLVVGKPVIPSDATNGGWVDASVVGEAVSRAYEEFGWFAGVSLWQYSSDVRGKSMATAGGHLKELCSLNKNCK